MAPPASRSGNLPTLPASDVKKRGWRGLMRTVRKDGAVVITNHREAEAVVLEIAEYEALIQLVEQSSERGATELDALRRRFDERLSALRRPGAADRLRAVARGPAKLGGKVKAGKTF